MDTTEFDDPDNIEKLENIFMPYMVYKRGKLKETNNQFVHYTSAENALSIINSKKLWLRSPRCMNDYSEIEHGHNQLVSLFGVAEHKKKFSDALDLYKKGFADEIFNAFDDWWKNIRYDTFIASISVHPKSEDQHGRLSMWRAYGEQSAKAALVLNNPMSRIKGLKVILSPAAYFSPDIVEKEISFITDNFTKNIDFLSSLKEETVAGTIIIALTILAICLKHPGFKEEDEWRIIYFPNLPQTNDLIKKSVETVRGVPQVVHKIPLENFPEHEVDGVSIPDLIDKIIIGPTPYPIALYDAFSIALKEAGVEDVGDRIVISDIPLRT